MTDKASLRNQFLYKRSLLTTAEQEDFNTQITKRVKVLLQNSSVSTVHTFLPQTGKKEIDTRKIITMIGESFPHIRLIAPRIVPGTRSMQHYLLTKETRLILNRWLIPEPDPATSENVHTKEIDVVLIPLLAFDKQGFRVGYGGGFYDRFLPQCRLDTKKIGLSFFEEIDFIDNRNEFDIAMDICITPQKNFYW